MHESADDLIFDRPEEVALDRFIGGFAIELRREAVRKLLAGNDTGCFTLDAYREAYRREWPSRAELPSIEVAEMHLRGLFDMVKEVRPGVWAAV